MYNFGVTLIRNSNLDLVNLCAIFKIKLNLTGALIVQFASGLCLGCGFPGSYG